MTLRRLWLFLALAGCATSANRPADGPVSLHVHIANVERGANVDRGERPPVKVTVEYGVPDLKVGTARLTALIDTTDGGAVDAGSAMIIKPQGERSFEFFGADLVTDPRLVRPLRVRFAIERKEPGQPFAPVLATKPINLELLGLPVTAQQGQGRLLSDVKNDSRYRPTLPVALSRRGMRVWGLYEICVDTAGKVSNVDIWQSADKIVDDDWVAKMRTWRYTPYVVDGRPTPFCHSMRLEVQVQ